MNIYPSTKVRPYVYMGFNPITGEFYIGYREANILPSHIDLFEYKTSSKIVKPIFNQMHWFILAEFEIGNDAYDFEQLSIYENWDNPSLLNDSCFHNKKKFKSKKGNNKGRKLPPRSKEHLAKLSMPKRKKRAPQSREIIENRVKKITGQRRTEECKALWSEQRKGKLSWHKGQKKSTKTIENMKKGQQNRKPASDEARENMSNAHMNKIQSQETKDKRAESMRIAWQKKRTPNSQKTINN